MHEITKKTLRHWAINMALFLAIIYILMLAAGLHWTLDLLSHFRIQLAVGCLLFLLVALCLKVKKSAILLTLVLGACLFDIFRYADFTKNSPDLPTFKIVQYNHLYTNKNFDEIQSWIEENHQSLDVLILQEAVPETSLMADRLVKLYPYKVVQIRDDAFGMVLLSKHPFIKSEILPINGPLFQNFILKAEINTPQIGHTVIYSLHALPPMGNKAQLQRNEELKSASIIIKNDPAETKIFAGDWNITPYSPYFHDVLNTTNLKHSFKTLNIGTSWPAPFMIPILQIPIDQIIFSKNLQLVSRETGPAVGSDHKPLIASFSKGN